MKRTINHTRKKTIPKSRIDIKVIKRNGLIERFKANLELDGLELSGDAKVYIEAYRRFQWNRYDYGTVDFPGAKEHLFLGDLKHSESLTFRVLVRDEEGKILGLREDVKPSEQQGVTPLLPVELDDIGQVIWRLDFTGENGGPVLVLNDDVPDLLNMARTDERFILSVYPEVLRRVLSHIIYVEENAKSITNLPEGWQRDWFSLARSILPEKKPPKVIDPEDHEYGGGEIETWLNDVRDEFSRKRTKEWRNFVEYMRRFDI